MVIVKDPVRDEHFAFRLKSSFSPVVKTTSDGKQSVLTLFTSVCIGNVNRNLANGFP